MKKTAAALLLCAASAMATPCLDCDGGGVDLANEPGLGAQVLAIPGSVWIASAEDLPYLLELHGTQNRPDFNDTMMRASFDLILNSLGLVQGHLDFFHGSTSFTEWVVAYDHQSLPLHSGPGAPTVDFMMQPGAVFDLYLNVVNTAWTYKTGPDAGDGLPHWIVDRIDTPAQAAEAPEPGTGFMLAGSVGLLLVVRRLRARA